MESLSSKPTVSGRRPRTSERHRARKVRLPVEVLRCRKLAETAWIRRRLRFLPEDHAVRKSLCAELRVLEERIAELSARLPEPAPVREMEFHRAALERAVELLGPDSRRAAEHAARLYELDSSIGPKGLLAAAAREVGHTPGPARGAATKGLMSYEAGRMYVFRRTAKEWRAISKPMNEIQAHGLLQAMDRDPRVFDRLATASRVAACEPDRLPGGEKLVIEVDQEGFWVSVVFDGGGQAVFDTAFPRFEDARHYVRGTLRTDLMAGAELTSEWTWSGMELGEPAQTGAEKGREEEGSLWSRLRSIPGYRTVFEEGVSEHAGSPPGLRSRI